MSGWIGVDLDRTLAHYGRWEGPMVIGMPIWPMVHRIKTWLSQGKEVRIFTARYSGFDLDIPEGVELRAAVASNIQDWLEEQCSLPRLQVTCEKDYACTEIWDDIAVSVIPNTGMPVADRRG